MLCGTSLSQSQGSPPTQPVTQTQSDIYYIPQNWHPGGLHGVYPGGAHWGSTMPPQGLPYGHLPYRQQLTQTQQENDTEMNKLKAALNGGQLERSIPNTKKSANEHIAENAAMPPKKKAGGVVKFDGDHMFCSPEPIELLGGKVTCYSVTNTLDGCQYFRCARCMKLQLFKSVDSILRHQSSQACKAQAKAKENMLENKPELEQEDKPTTVAGSPEEASASTKVNEVQSRDPAHLSPLARPTFRKATSLSPPSSGATDAPVNVKQSGEVQDHRHKLGTVEVTETDRQGSNNMRDKGTKDHIESAPGKVGLKLPNNLVCNNNTSRDTFLRIGSTSKVTCEPPDSPVTVHAQLTQLVPELPDATGGVDEISQCPTHDTRLSGSAPLNTSCLASHPVSNSTSHKTEWTPSVPLSAQHIEIKSSSPLRRFVELRAHQIHERFGSAFEENEITDILLLEWLRRQADPIPIRKPPVDGVPSEETTLDKPGATVSSTSIEAEPQSKVEAREPRAVSEEVVKTIPKKKTKSRKRQRAAKSEGSSERSVNEIALAWNKTFEQVPEDCTSAPKRRSRRGLLCESCNTKSSKETVKCSNCQKHWHKACHNPKLDEDMDFSTIEWVCWPCQKKWLAIRKVCHAVGDDIWSSGIRKNIWWPCKVVGLQCRHPYDPSIYCIQPYSQSDREKTSVYTACEKSIRKWHSINVESSEIASALSSAGKHLSGKNLKEVIAALNMARRLNNKIH